MAALADLRLGLKANLQAYFPDAQISGYVLSSPTPPFFDIELSANGTEYDEAFVRGHDLWRFTVRGVVSRNSDIGAQMNLDEWCESSGSSSVKEAIESDPTLGGAAYTCQVVRLASYRQVGLPATPHVAYLSAEWAVEIRARG